MCIGRYWGTIHEGIPCLDPANIPNRRSPANTKSRLARSQLHAAGAGVVYHVPMVEGNIETEAKWPADEGEHERLRTVLRGAGASHTGTVREVNTLFDSADEAVRLGGRVLRLRWLDDGRSILTLKGPATYDQGVKTREEAEVDLTDREAMIGILSGLGFTQSLEYQKTRESWHFEGAVVALDTLEFGRFVEIEGPEDQIRRAADLLGLDMRSAERRGYPSRKRAHDAGERLD
jgi:adenylate cyclase, class 2